MNTDTLGIFLPSSSFLLPLSSFPPGRYFERHIVVMQELENARELSKAYRRVGDCNTKTGRVEKGIIFYERAYSLAREGEWKEGQAEAFYGMAHAFLIQPAYNLAVSFFNKSHLLYEEVCDSKGIVMNLRGLMDCAEGIHDMKKVGLRHSLCVLTSSRHTLLEYIRPAIRSRLKHGHTYMGEEAHHHLIPLTSLISHVTFPRYFLAYPRHFRARAC